MLFRSVSAHLSSPATPAPSPPPDPPTHPRRRRWRAPPPNRVSRLRRSHQDPTMAVASPLLQAWWPPPPASTTTALPPCAPPTASVALIRPTTTAHRLAFLGAPRPPSICGQRPWSFPGSRRPHPSTTHCHRGPALKSLLRSGVRTAAWGTVDLLPEAALTSPEATPSPRARPVSPPPGAPPPRLLPVCRLSTRRHLSSRCEAVVPTSSWRAVAQPPSGARLAISFRARWVWTSAPPAPPGHCHAFPPRTPLAPVRRCWSLPCTPVLPCAAERPRPEPCLLQPAQPCPAPYLCFMSTADYLMFVYH